MSKYSFSKITTPNAAAALQLANTMNSQKKRGKDRARFFTILLFAFIVLFLLMLLTIGIQVYSTINDSREEGNVSRLGLSLIANNIRLNDRTGAIDVGVGPEGKALVFTENLETGSFETRIYLYQGKIVEEYTQASKTYMPDRAREVVVSDTFEFDYTVGVLNIHTDQGTTSVAIRSTGGV